MNKLSLKMIRFIEMPLIEGELQIMAARGSIVIAKSNGENAKRSTY